MCFVYVLAQIFNNQRKSKFHLVTSTSESGFSSNYDFVIMVDLVYLHVLTVPQRMWSIMVPTVE